MSGTALAERLIVAVLVTAFTLLIARPVARAVVAHVG